MKNIIQIKRKVKLPISLLIIGATLIGVIGIGGISVADELSSQPFIEGQMVVGASIEATGESCSAGDSANNLEIDIVGGCANKCPKSVDEVLRGVICDKLEDCKNAAGSSTLSERDLTAACRKKCPAGFGNKKCNYKTKTRASINKAVVKPADSPIPTTGSVDTTLTVNGKGVFVDTAITIGSGTPPDVVAGDKKYNGKIAYFWYEKIECEGTC